MDGLRKHVLLKLKMPAWESPWLLDALATFAPQRRHLLRELVLEPFLIHRHVKGGLVFLFYEFDQLLDDLRMAAR